MKQIYPLFKLPIPRTPFFACRIFLLYCLCYRKIAMDVNLIQIFYSSKKLQIYIKMEDSQSFNVSLRTTLSHLKLKSQKLDQVAAHCREDHITHQNFDQRKNRSCYRSTFSPPKLYNDYNHPIPQKEFQQFRKNQSSTLLLPTILNNSQYQSAFKPKEQQKFTKSKEKQSWFLKGEWALNPSSDYKQKFNSKNGKEFNKTNNFRSNYNTLTIFKLKQGQKGISSYDKDYKGYLLKKEGKLSIGNHDHLNGKQNHKIGIGLSEYQRRYDSIYEQKGQKEMVSSCIRNNFIKRNHL